MLAKLWTETVGERGIPFELMDRLSVLAEARRHPELRSHIEKWETIKSEGLRTQTAAPAAPADC